MTNLEPVIIVSHLLIIAFLYPSFIALLRLESYAASIGPLVAILWSLGMIVTFSISLIK